MLIYTQILLNGLIAGSIYSLVAVGFSLIYGSVRFFHFAHGALCAAGAYVAFWCATSVGLPLVLAAGAGALGAGVLGVGIDQCVYRPLRQSKSPDLVLLLASFGVFLLMTNLLQVLFGSDVVSLRRGPVREGYLFCGAIITGNQITIAFASVVLTIALWLFLKVTRTGRAIRAVADDPIGASIVGIHSDGVIRTAFFVGSLLAGVAGILLALETDLQPGMGMNAAIKGIIAAVIGGIGSIPGALVGGLLLGLAENLGAWFTSSSWKDAVAFAVLVVFLLLRPGGIVGGASRQRRV